MKVALTIVALVAAVTSYLALSRRLNSTVAVNAMAQRSLPEPISAARFNAETKDGLEARSDSSLRQIVRSQKLRQFLKPNSHL